MTVFSRPVSFKVCLYLVLLAAGALAFGAAPALADIPGPATWYQPSLPRFADPVSYAVGNHPEAVATGDFNTDGIADAAVVDTWSDTVSIMLGHGDGTFAKRATVNVGDHPFAIATGDFDRNGSVDLAVTNRLANSVSILLNNGSGHFTVAHTVAVGSHPMGIAATDFNRDGRLDLVVADYGTTVGQASILTGDGTGNFVAAQYDFAPQSPSANPRLVAAADFDGDGCPDIAVGCFFNSAWNPYTTNNLFIRHGDGAGGFKDAWSSVLVPSGPIGIQAVDWDNDGTVEIAGVSWTKPAPCLAWVYDGSVQNIAGQLMVDQEPIQPSGLLFAGLTNPGPPDMVMTFPKADETRVVDSPVFSPSPTPMSEQASHFAGTAAPAPPAAADLDRNGALDLLIPSYNGDKLDVLLRKAPQRHALGLEAQTSASATAAVPALVAGDLNHDDRADLITPSEFFAAGGPSGEGNANFGVAAPIAGNWPSGAPAATVDLNRDGILDIVSLDPAGNLWVYLGNGLGGVMASASFATGAAPNDVAIGDVNRDGSPDVVVVKAAPQVTVFLNDGSGGLTAHNHALNSAASGVALADFNGDGALDIVTANGAANSVSVLLNDGSGGLGSPANYAVGFAAGSVAVADFDRDGHLDVAAGGDAATTRVGVLLGNGSGALGAVSTTVVPAGVPAKVAATDITTDGTPDLVVPQSAGNQFVVLAGDGTGAFSSSIGVTVRAFTAATTAWVVADLDGDGVADLAVAGDNSAAPLHQVAVKMSDATPPVTVCSIPTSTPVPNPPGPPTEAQLPGTDNIFWTNQPYTVMLSPGDTGVGVARTYHRIGTQFSDYVQGTNFLIPAPTNHTNDGEKLVCSYSVDNIGNVERDVQYRWIGIDTLPPALTDDAPGAGVWENQDTFVQTGSADKPPKNRPQAVVSGAVPVMAYDGQGVETAPDGSLVVPAPYDHVNDGVHHITYYGWDWAGNIGQGSCDVRIDTIGPDTYALKNVTTRSGGTMSLSVRVHDWAPCASTDTVQICIANTAGKVLKRISLGKRKIDTTVTYETYCSLKPGTYRYYATATDGAGNLQVHANAKTLTVK